jgi:putative addiction module component (TIGR02574 family)
MVERTCEPHTSDMPRKPGLADFDELSPAEKILRLQDLWDQIHASVEPEPLTEAQAAEVDERLRNHRAGIGKSAPWSEVRDRLRKEP